MPRALGKVRHRHASSVHEVWRPGECRSVNVAVVVSRSCVFVGIAAVSAVAHASPAAEKLFQDGRRLLAEGKLDEACDALARSHELEPRFGTLLNLADCEEKRGRLATAWADFVEARAMAKRQNHPGASEADKRATALAPKLPYLTIKVSSPPAGLVVRRNGRDVAVAELDHEVPLDPGRYSVEATAPGHRSWSATAELKVGQHSTIEVPALVANGGAPTATASSSPTGPASPTSTTTTASTAPTPIDAPPLSQVRGHRYGVGVAAGLSTDSDLIAGIRVPLHLAVVGNGSLRAMPTALYAHIVDNADQYHTQELFAIGLGAEYVLPLAPTFFIAAGVGLGFDIVDDSYSGGMLDTNGWGAVRLSPTVRAGAFDLGLHLQVVVTADQVVGLGELGVDYFFD